MWMRFFDRAQQRIVEQILFKQRTVGSVDIPVPVVEELAEVYRVSRERVQQRTVDLNVDSAAVELVPQE